MRLRTIFLSCLCLASLTVARRSSAGATTASDGQPPLKVLVYDDGGAPDRSSGFIENCLGKLPQRYVTQRITGEDVRNGILSQADVAVFPGGSGSGQAKSLELAGREKVREFVKKGGGYLGICGGSYLATSYYPWSLNIVNAAVVDRKHWNRGRGTVRLDFSALGQSVLGVPTASVMCLYHQGPLLAPDSKPDLPPYQSLATFGTEVAENGAPKGVMLNTDAMVRTVCGKGRVILISPHPEQTPGLEYTIRSAIDWISHAEPAPSPLTGDQTTAKAVDHLLATTQPTTQHASTN